MSEDIKFETGKVLVGNCVERLRELPDGSIDSIVTDPPYELGFMGKKWDNSGIAYNAELWEQCLRVLKPGGHLLAFGGTRTYHRMAVAIEDAGFEIRDSIHWVYGSGFPKSHNVSKALDKEAGAERKVVGSKRVSPKGISAAEERSATAAGSFGGESKDVPVTAPATDAAKQWEGWGTALKPAHEPIVLARKPLAGTVAANVKEHGTGALNIDACRIGTDPITINGQGNDNLFHGNFSGNIDNPNRVGRFPANIIFDEAAGAELDAQSGVRPGGAFPTQRGAGVNTPFGTGQPTEGGARSMGDTGGASRFFYCPKPGKKERNAGLDGAPTVRHADRVAEDKPGGNNPRNRTNKAKQNFHPTVKPVALMRYLVRLITPPNGTVLDPFLGSGTTAVAAIEEGFNWVGCEMTADYLPIISGRVTHAEKDDE
jgi:DNA modification methylase